MSKPMETIVPIEPIEPIVPIEEIERKNLEEEKFLKGVTSFSDFENGENGKDTNNDEEIIKKIKDLAEKEIQDIFNDYKNNSILEEPNEQSSLEECDTYAYSKYLILQNML